MPRDIDRNAFPLLVAAKQRVGQEDADLIALPLLAWLDAAKRGQCTGTGCNHLTTHLIIASYLAARTKSKAFHTLVTRAYDQLRKAAERPTHLLDLTTGEYQSLRLAFSWYLRALPQIEVGMLNEACTAAHKMMGA
jgi:hypothetical protein